MYISPAHALFELSFIKDQSLFLNKFLLPHTQYLETLDQFIDSVSLSNSLHQNVPGEISILAYDLDDFYLANLVSHFLTDSSVETVTISHYCSSVVNIFSSNRRVKTVLFDPVTHEHCNYSCSSCFIPFSGSICRPLFSLLDKAIPSFEDSQGNIHLSILGLCLALNDFNPELLDQLVKQLFNSLEVTSHSSLEALSGPQLVSFFTPCSDYPISRLINFSKQSIFECLPTEVISKDTQYTSVRSLGESESINSFNLYDFKLTPSEFLPYMLTVFLNKGGGGNALMTAIADSLSCSTMFAEEYLYDPCGIPFVWGVLRNSKSVVDYAVSNNNHFIYADHAYFNRGHGASYRISANSFECNTFKRCPADRRSLFDIECKPWNKSGSTIIVCPPTEYFAEAHKVYGWLDQTIFKLKQYTDRKIIVRKKPQSGQQVISLSEQLRSAHALVTHSSNVAIESICYGTPVFVSDSSAARPVGLSDLSLIETPIYPDRDMWLNNLSYSQFTFDEFKSGLFFDLFKQYHSYPDALRPSS